MNPQELKDKYYELYDYMAQSKDPKNMKVFGSVMNEMMEVMLQKMPPEAEQMISKLESVKWRNYLTPAEADKIVEAMDPQAPWDRAKWNAAMQQHGFQMEEEPYYNRCALFVTMDMIMSDSGETISNYVDSEEVFPFVHDLAVDKLKDKDRRFIVREYFGL